MAKNANLKNSVAQVVKTNGVKGITGANLQPTILQVIDKLGGGYQFGGLVQPNGTFPVDVNGNSLTDQNFAFLASTPGTYTNFGGLVVNDGEVCVFLWDGTWTKQVTGIVTGSKMAEDYAKKVGIYAGLTAGISCGIADSISNGTPQQFTLRQSGGDGVNYMKRIKGRTLVWNQLKENGDFSFGNTAGWGGLEYDSTERCGKWTIQANTWGDRSAFSGNRLIIGHKYFLKTGLKAVTNESIGMMVYNVGDITSIPVQCDNKWEVGSGVFTATGTNNIILQARFKGSNDITAYVKFFMLIDLTLMFGAGNEPSTVAELEALYPKPYYDYNAGVKTSNDAAAVKTRGFNQWDEEWEVGALISNGTVDTSAFYQQRRTTSFIRVIPGATYYVSSGARLGRYALYDTNKTLVVYNETGVVGSGLAIPANASYLRITFPSGYGATYNHDVCVNIFDAAKNGTYEPYWKRTILLGLTTRKDTDGNIPFPNGMQSCPVAYDEADELGGTVRVGARAYEVGDEENANVTTDGTTTNYALAEPVPFTWAEPLPNAILVDDLGTEEAVFPEHLDGTPSAPFCCDSNYSISVKNLVAALAALNANLGGGE